MRLETIVNDLKQHEGFSPHAYQDHLGYWTIGYGRLIDEARGGGITDDEAEMLLENDITRVYSQLHDRIHYFSKLPHQVQRALINMAFQLGVRGLLAFRKTLKYIEKGQYVKAADEALRSRWANQTPRRAKEVTDWIRFS